MSQFQRTPFNHPPQYPQQPSYTHPGTYQQQVPQPYPPRDKHRERKEIIVTISIILAILALVLGVGLAYVASDHGTSTSNGTSNSVATWTTTHTFSGNGVKQTETFTVPSDWMILWSCNAVAIENTSVDGALVVYVYNADSSLADVAVNATCKADQTTNDSTEEHRGGSIYLKIDSTSTWTVQIQELQ